MITQTNRTEIKNIKEFESEELFGSTVTRLLSDEKLPTVGFDYVRIATGSTLAPHIHEASEAFVYILEGMGVVTLEGKDYPVKAGDTVYVPAGASHGFRTLDEAVVLLSVQSPPIYPDQGRPDINFGKN